MPLANLSGGHTEGVLCADCDHAGNGNIVTGGEDGAVCLWDLNGHLVGNLQTNTLYINLK